MAVLDNPPFLLVVLIVILLVSLIGLFYLLYQSYRLAVPKVVVPVADVAPYLTLLQQPDQRFLIQVLPFSIGRAADNALTIDEGFVGWKSVSRNHAQIEQQQLGQASYYVITDLASQNGTCINGRLTPKNLLQDGMRITLGKVAFVFHVGEEA